MAGEWIKVEKSTPDKPEVLRLARLWGIDKNAAFGLVVRFWMWLDNASVDGVVDGVASHELDDLMHMPGFCGGMVKVKWLIVDEANNSMRVPNFSLHSGESAKKRALTTRRQANWRNAVVDDHVDAKVTQHALPEKKRIDIKTKVGEKVGGLEGETTYPQNPGDKSPKANGKTSGDWWRSEAGIAAKAKELGIAPNPGETYAELKGRCFEHRQR